MNLELIELLKSKFGLTDLKLLGAGGFGVVYSGLVYEIPRAIKISKEPLDEKLLHMAENELVFMKQPAIQDCATIVQLAAVWRELGYLITVWELGEKSLAACLAEHQKQGNPGIPSDELARYLRDAAAALDVINGLGIRHRDIKPDNIILVRGRAKITDLGLALFVGASSLSKTASGTMGYIAPEAYGDNGRGKLTATVDIYALAATAIKLTTGRDPFGSNPREIIKNQESSQAITHGLTKQQTKAVLAALQADPNQRPFQTATAFVAAFLNAGQAPKPVVVERPVSVTPAIATPAVPAETAASDLDLRGVAREIIHPAGIRMKLILPGEFLMGTTAAQVQRLVKDCSDFKAEYANDEQPLHRVRITEPFYIGVTPVTQGQWKAIMGAKNNPSHFKGDDQLPVERVSWDMLNKEFLPTANRKHADFGSLRLPTEAEWEYCCRAGTTTIFPWGDDVQQIGMFAWFDKNSAGKTHPVGHWPANAWGLHDMCGMVWEWCRDWYDAQAYKGRKGTTQNPEVTTGSQYRVLRGGSWLYFAWYARSAFRNRITPDYRLNNIGCRVVLPVSASRTP